MALARRARVNPARTRTELAAATLIVAGLIGLFTLFDWNLLRGPLGRSASVQTGRTVVLAGRLDVHPWSRTPGIEVRDLFVGQPAWAGDGAMARIGRLSVKAELSELLRGRLVLSSVQVDGTSLVLIRDRSGRDNWTFGPRPGRRASKFPVIRRLVINRATVSWTDARRGAVFRGLVTTEDDAARPMADGFHLTGAGILNGAPFEAVVTGAALRAILPDRPYRFSARVKAGDTRIKAVGQIDRPFDLERLGARFTISGSDLNALYPLIGLALPNTGRYSMTANLVRDRDRYHLNALTGRIGASDIAGQITVEAGGPRPLLLADIRSRRLDLADLSGLMGMSPPSKVGRSVAAEPVRLLPDSTLQVDRIRAMDAKVRYRAGAVNAPGLPLRQVALTLGLNQGVLTLDPLSFSLDRGSIRGRVMLDARGPVPLTDLDLRMSGSRIENWITRRVGGLPVAEGTMAARVKLTGTGNSIHKAASSANGSLTLVSSGGQVRQAFAELLGVNISKGLILLLSEDPRKTPLRCAVADFRVSGGVARAERIVLDTGVVRIEGTGSINLKQETLSIRLEGESKKPRLLRIFAPITLSGPWVAPKVGEETGGLVGQGGAAAILGAVASPIAALLAFVDPGLARDVNCTALLQEGRSRGAPSAR